MGCQSTKLGYPDKRWVGVWCIYGNIAGHLYSTISIKRTEPVDVRMEMANHFPGEVTPKYQSPSEREVETLLCQKRAQK